MKKSIVFFIPKLAKGGPDRVFFNLTNGLNKAGLAVKMLCYSKGGHYWDILTDSQKKYSLDTNEKYPLKKFRDFIRKDQPDVVMCSQNAILVAAFARLLYRLKFRLIVRPANHLTRNSRELISKSPIKHRISLLAIVISMKMADVVICQSQDLYDDFRKYGIPEKKLRIIGNPIQLPEQKVRDVSQKAKLQLLMMGRLSPQKGYDILIEAMKKVIRQRQDVHLKILGDGPDRAMLEERIAKYNLTDYVELLGHQPDTLPYIKEADFLVSSSRYEGFPNAVLEAMSHGMPVLATDSPGGTKALVVHGVTGLLCENESALGLSEIIIKANSADFESPSILKHIENNFSLGKISEEYREVIEQITI